MFQAGTYLCLTNHMSDRSRKSSRRRAYRIQESAYSYCCPRQTSPRLNIYCHLSESSRTRKVCAAECVSRVPFRREIQSSHFQTEPTGFLPSLAIATIRNHNLIPWLIVF